MVYQVKRLCAVKCAEDPDEPGIAGGTVDEIPIIARYGGSKLDNANQFSKSATELERLMYWRNCKLKIIIGLIVISILAYILVPIIQKATSK